MNMLEKIQLQLENLSKSERKVAEVILASPATAMHSSIALLARAAGVSEPTVNRFCHRLDANGFPDFKLQLAQSLANGTPYVSRNVEQDDSVESYSGKIFESAMAGLDRVKQSLDVNAVNRAVDLLTQSKKIAFFGLGASAAVAHDAMNKFFRFNVPVIYSDDIVMQRMSCMNSGEGDVMVLISHTGRTKSMVELAMLARENDATVLAITSPGSPLAREATLALTLDVPEDTDIYMPMVSRLAQLTLIDVLATGFTLRRGAKFRDNLKRVKEALKDSRFEKESLISALTRQ
ncbi:transcriptional regulator [bacteria symbiont BFo1 of Frankliniella occidentalis]|jgi:RpiR family carbohydrate utilization transcriptional regulator|uniref:MurR/RpiR family transcriptional regulator n=1 Tax=Erwinia aphidicola TaxID=68334 RepID=A0ABU8DE85_ERWAP|nr:MurR/RpiR family transcriptional regulator [Erwinia aphidicola]KMV70974.1 transcriptional regulator [bacteria symbiont BFo1 of Frankliniella occidentalis]KYP85232.1 transcriptional regulator [bacteria symbiont BFo1 of Frankliniella occidentalis]KYP90440.1 transcriptional regulator [bacteria symbiont BFo1 of Frankliniella occidentalis]MBD1374472.1 MurR/RpiR family transcriptional regulator [Erwinia aphidicola]MCP2233182.1 RpiR family carbohydrate utilization transcriptional regulator [Erwini